MEIEFYGTYDKKMFVEALQLSEKRSTLNAILRYFALGLALVIIVGTIYGWVLEGMESSRLGQLARNLIGAIFIGYFYMNAIITRNRSVSNLFKEGPRRTMQGSVTLEGILIGSPPHTSTIPWDRFINKGEKGQLFVLMTVDGSVAVLHRDFFKNDADWQRFKQLAVQKVIEPNR